MFVNKIYFSFRNMASFFSCVHFIVQFSLNTILNNFMQRRKMHVNISKYLMIFLPWKWLCHKHNANIYLSLEKHHCLLLYAINYLYHNKQAFKYSRNCFPTMQSLWQSQHSSPNFKSSLILAHCPNSQWTW